MRHGGFRLHIPEEDASLMLIVGATAELNIVICRGTPGRIWNDVMELEECGFAAPACAADERAPSLIPLADSPPYSGWYVAPSATTAPTCRAWRCDAGKPSPLEIVDQERQGAIEDRAKVSIRQRMSCKGLGPPQLFMRFECQRQMQLDDGGSRQMRAQ